MRNVWVACASREAAARANFFAALYSLRQMKFRPANLSVRQWAVFRLVPGFMQMAGATASLALLLSSGLNEVSLTAAVLTGLMTAVSALLFGGRGEAPDKWPAVRKGPHGQD